MFVLHLSLLLILFFEKISSSDGKEERLKNFKHNYKLPQLPDVKTSQGYLLTEIDRKLQIESLIAQMGAEIDSLFWGYATQRNRIESDYKTKRECAESTFKLQFLVTKGLGGIFRTKGGNTIYSDEFTNLEQQFKFELYKMDEEKAEKLAKVEKSYFANASKLAFKFKTLHDLIDERTLGFVSPSSQKTIDFYYKDILSENDPTRRFYERYPEATQILELIHELQIYAPQYSTFDPNADQPEINHFFHAAIKVAFDCVTNDSPNPRKIDKYYCGLLSFSPENSILCQVYRSLFSFLTLPQMIPIVQMAI